MTEHKQAVWAGLQTIAAFLVGLMGGVDEQLITLLILWGVNLLVGWGKMRACRESFDHERMQKAAICMAIRILLIVCAVRMDMSLSHYTGGRDIARTGFITWFSMYYLGSILHNAVRAGVQVPGWIERLVDKALEALDKGMPYRPDDCEEEGSKR